MPLTADSAKESPMVKTRTKAKMGIAKRIPKLLALAGIGSLAVGYLKRKAAM